MKNIENIFDVYEIKQSLNSALGYVGTVEDINYIDYPDRRINLELRLIFKMLTKDTIDEYSLTSSILKLNELLYNDYHWWRFSRLNEKLNQLFNLGLSDKLRARPQI